MERGNHTEISKEESGNIFLKSKAGMKLSGRLSRREVLGLTPSAAKCLMNHVLLLQIFFAVEKRHLLEDGKTHTYATDKAG